VTLVAGERCQSCLWIVTQKYLQPLAHGETRGPTISAGPLWLSHDEERQHGTMALGSISSYTLSV